MILFEQVEEFFIAVQERRELLSVDCCRITGKVVQHSLFQFGARQRKREKDLKYVFLSYQTKTVTKRDK